MTNITAVLALALGLQAAGSAALSLRFKSRAETAVPTFPTHPSWQIILRNQVKIPPTNPPIQPDNVDVWDIDLFENTNNGQDSSAIRYLKGLPNNPRVICYFSAGSYEPERSDWPANFDRDLYGNKLIGWDEWWLDINSTVVQEVMFNRIRLAARLGCDAVDPDNVVGYGEAPNNRGNRTGKAFTLTEDKSVAFVQNMARVAHGLNIGIGLKNAFEILERVDDVVDFAVNEQCVETRECSKYDNFVQTKPVFHIEYQKGADNSHTPLTDTTTVCTSYNEAGPREPEKIVDLTKLSTVIKNMNLDGWVEFCDKTVKTTELAPED
ncbi:endo alpha-1,4 polygalactosaminidase precursor [Coniochaeta sp. 2T2.1]|nr:endo alpha-1,4 polygalactosaminidase precursor [Coniochaeta sp. 2T2.1]